MLRHTRTSTYHMVMGLGAVPFFSRILTFLQIPPFPSLDALDVIPLRLSPIMETTGKKSARTSRKQPQAKNKTKEGTSPNVGQSA